MKVRVILCGFLLTMSGLTVGAGQKISLRASPAVSFAPTNLTVRTAIEPNADNRALQVIVDSPNFYRSSTLQLEGDQAPRTSVLEFRGVPSGSYEITARLLDQSGESLGYARSMVDVIGAGDR